MLKEKKIARSYATALFEVATERQLLEVIRDDMALIGVLLSENHELVNVLASPVITGAKKTGVLRAILEGHVHDLTLRFLLLLVKSLRVLYLAEIADEFHRQYKVFKGIRTVKLKTVTPLPEETRDILMTKLRNILGSEIEMIESLDTRLIGGFIVQVDDARFDASVRSKLHKLSRQFDINIYQKGF